MSKQKSLKKKKTPRTCDNKDCLHDQDCQPIRRYTSLNDKARDGIFSISLKREILYANQTARRLFQLPPKKSLKGYSFDSLVDAKCFKKIKAMVASICCGKNVNLFEFNARGLKGAVFPAEMIVSPECDGEKVTEIHLLIRNIANRRQFEELLKESERRKAMQEVLVGTSQEIVNPLKGLLNSSEDLLEKFSLRDFEYIGYKDFKDIFRSIDTIRNQVNQCLRITNNLIALNKRKVGIKHEACAVNKEIESIIKSSLLHIENDSLNLNLDLGEKIPQVAVGLIEFRQVIENVFLNAAQSVTSKGRVTIKTRFLKRNNVVRIDCKDNGVGIPQDILERIFEPFFSTKQQGTEKSSGLGLTIVHGLVRAFKGEITIKSAMNQGTLVSIFFPVVKK
ncbi:nitrogen regulation protein NR(II) [Candidatus Omnitrophota bacterium]